MPQVSFRRCARSFVPGANPRKLAALGAAVLLISGCGGGGSGPAKEQTVRGTGFGFSAPAGWTVERRPRVVQVGDGIRLLSVTRYALLRTFRPALWKRVVAELDRAANGVAQQQNGRVTASRDLTVSGLHARRYDISYTREGKSLVERITFVLRGKSEYYLLCRYEGGDTGACDRLLETFTLRG